MTIRRSLSVLLAPGLALALSAVVAQAGSVTEAEVKAAYIFNFAKFVTWPEEKFADSDSPIRIGIVGDGDFAGTVEETVKEKQVDGRSFVVIHFDHERNVEPCHILFLGSNDGGASVGVGATDRPGVLTVGDSEGFAVDGGMIGFYMEENKVRFEVNVGAAKGADLRISSKMLSLARIVGESGNGGATR